MRLAKPSQMDLFDAEQIAPGVAKRFVGDLGKETVYIPGEYKEYDTLIEDLDTAGAQKGGRRLRSKSSKRSTRNRRRRTIRRRR